MHLCIFILTICDGLIKFPVRFKIFYICDILIIWNII